MKTFGLPKSVRISLFAFLIVEHSCLPIKELITWTNLFVLDTWATDLSTPDCVLSVIISCKHLKIMFLIDNGLFYAYYTHKSDSCSVLNILHSVK